MALWLLRWGALAWLALAAAPVLALTTKATYATHAFFVPGSSALPRFHQGLDGIACRARQLNLEVIIVVGHAARGEPGADALSLRRAHAVRDRLLQLGVPPGRVFAEGQGDRQPVSDAPARNRRAEIELVGTRQESDLVCEPGWDQSFLDLSPQNAAALAHALVREGMMAPHAPALAAIRARRMAHLDALLAGPSRLPLSRKEGPDLLRAAILWGGPAYAERVIAWGMRPADVDTRLPLLWLACDGGRERPSDQHQVALAKLLLAWGARQGWVRNDDGREESALQCAAGRGWAGLVAVLLDAGADPDLPRSRPPVLIAGNGTITRRLVAAGADPRVGMRGKTLAHHHHFASVEDVAWVAGLGVALHATKEGGSPLAGALYYAAPEVLDAFVRHGARVEELRDSSWGSISNVPGVLWLLAQGLPWQRLPEQLRGAAGRGDVALPVFEAVRRRGVDFAHAEVEPAALMKAAVGAFAPALVEWLLAQGAVPRGPGATGLRMQAENLQLEDRSGYYPSPETLRARNTPEFLRDREERRQRIVELLRAFE